MRALWLHAIVASQKIYTVEHMEQQLEVSLLRIQNLSDAAFCVLGENGAHACAVFPLLCKEGLGEVELLERQSKKLYPTSPPLTKGEG